MMGCGKTTVGKALAESLQLEFVDIDKEIEIAENMTISEIFAQKGELFFRKIEKNILQKFANSQNIVLSTGGGIVEDEENLKFLNENFYTIYLKTSSEELFDRIKNDNTRPLLKTDNPKKTLENLLKKRENNYQKAQKIVISDKKIPEQIVKEIKND